MKKTQKRKNNGKKTQKMWKMRGCANKTRTRLYKQKGGCGCGIQMGGKKRIRRGGHMSLSPSPFVNRPWLPPIQSWPGVQGSGTGNWLTKNQMNVDVSERTAIQERAGEVFPLQMGGRTKRRMKRGAGPFSDFVNMGRSFGYGVHSAYSNLVGAATMPVNPLPTADQFQHKTQMK